MKYTLWDVVAVQLCSRAAPLLMNSVRGWGFGEVMFIG